MSGTHLAMKMTDLIHDLAAPDGRAHSIARPSLGQRQVMLWLGRGWDRRRHGSGLRCWYGLRASGSFRGQRHMRGCGHGFHGGQGLLMG